MPIRRTSSTMVFTLLLTIPWIDVVAQNTCDSSPDAVYYNATVITMDEDMSVAEALAVKADTIVGVGSTSDMLTLIPAGCGAARVDLDGLTILPGFNDSHNHWFSWPEHICSLSGETTYPELTEIMPMLSENGWTSIAELNFGRPDFAPAHLEKALSLDAEGLLSVRVNGYWGTYDDPSMIDVLADADQTPATFYSDRVRARGVKMYVDDPLGGADIMSQEQVNTLVRAAHDAGWQIAAHAVNESGVEKILTAYEIVLGDESNAQRRHRIEHAVKVTDNQLDRMAAKEIIASFQLLGPADWPTQADFGDRFLGDHPEWVMRWSDMIEAQDRGLKITGSTDAPFNDAPCNYSPFEIIYQAVTRDGYAERTPADWELEQQISIEDALKLLTIHGAYATGEEDRKGSLTAGKWADFVILTDNPLAVTMPEELKSIEVLATFVGAEAEYCAEETLSAACSLVATFATEQGMVSASDYLPDQTPDLAFDGDEGTNWGSGDGPPQWIRIEFDEPIRIEAIEMVPEQDPAGRTVHSIWGRPDDPGAGFGFVGAIDQETESGQRLTVSIPTSRPPFGAIEVRTTSSPSWVSWREIVIREAGAVATEGDQLPSESAVLQNYPNPFSSRTSIDVQVEPGSFALLEVIDLWGRRVRTWKLTSASGFHSLMWDGSDQAGAPVASGIYFLRLSGNDVDMSRTVTLTR